MKAISTLAPITLLLVGLACAKQESAAPSVLPTVKVRLAPNDQGVETGWIAATLSATHHATLATRMAASVKAVHANEGQTVAAGALLISLADEDLQAGLKAAEANLAAATAYHRRIEALMAQNAAIPAEQDQARTQLAQAQAAVSQIKANIAYTQIRAPFAGVIQSRLVNEGAFVGPGTPLLELEGQGDLELVGSVSEAEGLGLKLGQKLPFEADGQRGLATLTALATGGDPVSHRGTLRARVPAGTKLRSGSFARLQLASASTSHQAAPANASHPSASASTTPQLTVPRSALIQRGDLNGVFVVRDGKAELRWLSLGEAQGDRFPVRAGLAPSEQVIDQPGALVDGQPVEVNR
jgi:RND family efflux transporter MFP subunit